MKSVPETTHKRQKSDAHGAATGVPTDGVDGQPRESGAERNESAALVRFQILLERNARFRKAWDHRGYDLPCRECQQVLVECAVTAKWTDAEIANLLIAHHARFNQDQSRAPNFDGIITKARKTFSRAQAIRDLELLIAPEARARDDDGELRPVEPQDEAAHKAAILKQISVIFGLKGKKEIVRIERFLCEPRVYSIVIAARDSDGKNKSIKLAGIRDLADQKRLYWHIADLAAEMIPAFTAAQWRIITQALLDACVDLSVGEEATDIGLVNAWLEGYLTPDRVLDSFAEQDRKGHEPFRHDGQVHLFLEAFRRWIYVNHGDRVPEGQLCVLLRRAGAEPVAPHVYRDGKRTSVRTWRLPETTEKTATPSAGEDEAVGYIYGRSSSQTNPFSKVV